MAVVLTAQAVSQQPPKNRLTCKAQPKPRSKPAREPSEKTVKDRRWVRSLPSGETLEVVGISSFPTGPDSWWRPDGTPLHQAPCDRFEAQLLRTQYYSS